MRIKESTLRMLVRDMLATFPLSEAQTDTGDTGVAADTGDSAEDPEKLIGKVGKGDVWAASKGIILWPNLPKNVKIIYTLLNPTDESPVGLCDQAQCTEFVSAMLNRWQGEGAWWAHFEETGLRSVFNRNVASSADKMAELFSEMNASFNNWDDSYFNSRVKEIIGPMVPSSAPWSDLKLGDVVGLWYGPSNMKSRAFFEGATGRKDWGKGRKVMPTYFARAADGKIWDPSMLDKNIKFKAGKTLKGGRTFGMNSHIGFVGAIKDGEPIVFHNIYGTVWATPLSAMKKGGKGSMMVWSRSGS